MLVRDLRDGLVIGRHCSVWLSVFLTLCLFSLSLDSFSPFVVDFRREVRLFLIDIIPPAPHSLLSSIFCGTCRLTYSADLDDNAGVLLEFPGLCHWIQIVLLEEDLTLSVRGQS